jgi:hypothetical protein
VTPFAGRGAVLEHNRRGSSEPMLAGELRGDSRTAQTDHGEPARLHRSSALIGWRNPRWTSSCGGAVGGATIKQSSNSATIAAEPPKSTSNCSTRPRALFYFPSDGVNVHAFGGTAWLARCPGQGKRQTAFTGESRGSRMVPDLAPGNRGMRPSGPPRAMHTGYSLPSGSTARV